MQVDEFAGGEIAQEFSLIWLDALKETPHHIRTQVSAIADRSAVELADIFYTEMQTHERARLFLDNELVNKRLHTSMSRWVHQLFSTLDESAIPAAIAHQIQVGSIHARIRLPAELMQMGFRNLGRELRKRCRAEISDAQDLVAAIGYVMDIFHIADSLMLISFVRDLQSRVRREEAYRVISMDHDVSLERERQRAALSEWVNRLLMHMRSRSRSVESGTLGESEFGLWLKHKAPIFFEGIQDLEHVFDVVRSIDEIYLPQLTSPDSEPELVDRLMAEFDRKIEFIRYLISDLFARLNKVTLGRDTVTRLLNRRYLPTIIGREIAAHSDNSRNFSVLLVRVDRLNMLTTVDDREGRDLLLQQFSVVISESVRAGDHAFRYSEDEFLLILVESDIKMAAGVADDLRLRIRSLDFHLPARTVRRVTVSIGVAQFEGHPDYQYLLQRAEGALASASREGGDRKAVAA